MMRLRVAVPEVPAADYDVLVKPGLLGELPALVQEQAPAAAYAVITDANVAPLYGSALVSRFQEAGLTAGLHVHAAGDAAKSVATWAALVEELLGSGIGRDGCVLGLGGGVAGDLAGFVAATLHRGIAFVQVPTSLLAMVDASIGGKTAVNTPHGKNLLGAFLPPRLVVIDPDVLATLPAAELRSGTAEVVKHGAVLDAPHFEEVAQLAPAILRGDPRALEAVVRRSVTLKAEVVARDPWERGERAVLNFGHTLGHALERVTGYQWPHGHAVAAGMVAAACAGELAGVTERGTARTLAGVLTSLALPLAPPPAVTDAELIAAAALDKKVRAGRARYVLLRRVGEVARPGDGGWTFELPESLVRAALAEARALAAR